MKDKITECQECGKHLYIEYKCKQCGKRFCSPRCRTAHKCPKALHSLRRAKEIETDDSE